MNTQGGGSTVATAVTRILAAEGVDTVFGIPGGYLFHLLRAFEAEGVRVVPGRHEAASGFAAGAFAQATQGLGVCFGQGPGAANLLTALASAYYDSTPLLAIASQAPQQTYASDAHQEASGSNFGVDQMELFRPVTRAVFRPPTPESCVRSMRRAIAIALAERGPVMIELAANLLTQPVELEELLPAQYRVVPNATDVGAVAEAARLIRQAQRPVLLIGNRASHRGLGESLARLCENADLPFAPVGFAKGVIAEDHPLALGVCGHAGHEGVDNYLAESDLVITLGMRLDSKATVGHRRSHFGNLVQIDEVAADIGRNMPLRLGVLGDIGATVRELERRFVEEPVRRSSPARELVRANRAQHATYGEPVALDGSKAGLTGPRALHLLREVLPREAVMVGDSGLNLHYMKRFFPALARDGFHCFYGWAAMGSGLPTAIGVAVGRPKEPIVLVIGDGGLLVHAGELQVLAEEGIPLLVVVLNNAGYQQVGMYMEKFLGSTYTCPIREIDAAAIGRSFGCAGESVRSAEELGPAVGRALAHKGPTVLDLKLSGDRLDDTLLSASRTLVDRVYVGKK